MKINSHRVVFKLFTGFLLLVQIILSACSNYSSRKYPSKDNFLVKIDCDSVVAYCFSDTLQGLPEIIDRNGKLASGIRSRTTMNDEQKMYFTNFITSPETFGGEMASCFDPHFGIVFYANGKPIEDFSICLDCNRLKSSIDFEGVLSGFSKKGAERIIEFQTELDFKH